MLHSDMASTSSGNRQQHHRDIPPCPRPLMWALRQPTTALGPGVARDRAITTTLGRMFSDRLWARHWDRGRWWDRESRTDTGYRPTAAKRRERAIITLELVGGWAVSDCTRLQTRTDVSAEGEASIQAQTQKHRGTHRQMITLLLLHRRHCRLRAR